MQSSFRPRSRRPMVSPVPFLPALVLFLSLYGLALPVKVYAFKAGAHWAIARKVAEYLPVGNRVKTAMLNQPESLAWSCVGPDLAGYLPGYAIERIGWFDAYHCHSVGTYCGRLMSVALESNDDRQIAFAAGWITHIAADMAVHGLLVNPEAGVLLDPENNLALHNSLEGYADSVIWNDIAKLSAQDFTPYTENDTDTETTKLYARFVSGPRFGKLTVPEDGCLEKLVDRVNREVILGNERYSYLAGTGRTKALRFGDYFGPDNMRFAEKVFAEILATKDDLPNTSDLLLTEVVGKVAGKMKMYEPLVPSRNELAKTGKSFNDGPSLPTRKKRLVAAWDQSNAVSRALLINASRGDYSRFSDSWTAYAGIDDGRAVGNLRLVVETGRGNKSFMDGAGTNHAVYFGMEWDDDTSREWRLETKGYDDFEAGDRDVYYLHCYDDLPIRRVRKIWIRVGLEKTGPDLPWWNLQSFDVLVNDKLIYRLPPGDHWTESGSTREAGLDEGNGLDPMKAQGWPEKTDPALKMGRGASKF